MGNSQRLMGPGSFEDSADESRGTVDARQSSWTTCISSRRRRRWARCSTTMAHTWPEAWMALAGLGGGVRAWIKMRWGGVCGTVRQGLLAAIAGGRGHVESGSPDALGANRGRSISPGAQPSSIEAAAGAAGGGAIPARAADPDSAPYSVPRAQAMLGMVLQPPAPPGECRRLPAPLAAR
ncbi:uncharacterized protein BDZ99DRAFT_515943 [Mytilinidion resinicola]|uniref:Uncharacterized protein n=1 Tax=Mytilinidion resinicola TaxID=574789 RepID=A0A6A6Z209_9PEZI|nr:uncharacterized protein BDZ99DRAFT_515943 [Mytilinidion resinicola]KAF2815202.1 hypothetical protein BDZ99DRAFT_515943 [Mytilinidion resinicola]